MKTTTYLFALLVLVFSAVFAAASDVIILAQWTDALNPAHLTIEQGQSAQWVLVAENLDGKVSIKGDLTQNGSVIKNVFLLQNYTGDHYDSGNTPLKIDTSSLAVGEYKLTITIQSQTSVDTTSLDLTITKKITPPPQPENAAPTFKLDPNADEFTGFLFPQFVRPAGQIFAVNVIGLDEDVNDQLSFTFTPLDGANFPPATLKSTDLGNNNNNAKIQGSINQAGTYGYLVTVTDGKEQFAWPVFFRITAVQPKPQCSDNIDNDNDGKIDMNDPGCDNPQDNDETDKPKPTACNDGIDNDGDGKIDMNDPGCDNPQDNDETDKPKPTQCNDGIDNDGDGKIDMNDPGCDNPQDNDETDKPKPTQCNDGIDNDNDGKIDMNDPGCDNPQDNDETDKPKPTQCNDQIDNDKDGQIDFPQDGGCMSSDDNDEFDSKLLIKTVVVNTINVKKDFTTIDVEQGKDLDFSVDLENLFKIPTGILNNVKLTVGYNDPNGFLLDQMTQNVGTINPNSVVNTKFLFNIKDTTPVGFYVIKMHAEGIDAINGNKHEDNFNFFIQVGEKKPLPAQCNDGIDNDNDGKIDMNDPGCDNPQDNDETDKPKPTACNDGIDNDNDGKIDMNDPGCDNPQDNDETDKPKPTQCNDGIDNDNDGKIDMNDPGCSNPDDNDESDPIIPNHAPIFGQIDDLTVFEDQLLQLTFTITDQDNDPLTITSKSADNILPDLQPINGNGVDITDNKNGTYTLQLKPAFTFVKHPSTQRVFTLVLEAQDKATTVSTSFKITVIDVNREPKADNQNISTKENIPVGITLTAADPDEEDNSSLKYTVLTQPVNGKLSGAAPTVTYTPNATFVGTDSFTFAAQDQMNAKSNDGTITITVTENDQDNDGIPDDQDNCPATPNPDQKDTDGDGIGDACDTPEPVKTQCNDSIDNDNDGKIDMNDPGCANPQDNDETDVVIPPKTQCSDNIDNDNDGLIDLKDPGCTNAEDNDESNPKDTDNDGIPDNQDNCPTVKNPDQKDSDKDGIGDACDSTPFPPKAEEKVEISAIHSLPEDIVAGDYVNFTITTSNAGNQDEKDMKVSLIIYDLGVKKSTSYFDLDKDEKATRNIAFQIPVDAESGEYLVKINASNDKVHETAYRLLSIN